MQKFFIALIFMLGLILLGVGTVMFVSQADQQKASLEPVNPTDLKQSASASEETARVLDQTPENNAGGPPVFDNSTPYQVVQKPVDLQYPLPDSRVMIGINVNELNQEDTSFPFIDLFRQGDPFAQNVMYLNSEGVKFDDDGWPTVLPPGTETGSKFLGRVPPDALFTHQFRVIYEGEANLRYGHNASLVSRQPGADLIEVSPGEDGLINASLVVTWLNPDNPIRNIRIIPIGGVCESQPYTSVKSAEDCSADDFLDFEVYHQALLWLPEYLGFMSQFHTLRFMPMSGITRNPVIDWSDRPRMEKATWGGVYGERGAPLEIQVDLAKRLNAHAWFNLPHAGDDHYARQSAIYVRDHLPAHLEVFIEYSNEVWNTNFSHSEYTQKRGVELGLSKHSVEAGYQYYIQRAKEVYDIWQKELGPSRKLTRILGAWDTRTDITKQLLSKYKGYEMADALAIAPYVGGNIAGYRKAKTVDDIFRLTTVGSEFRSIDDILEHVRSQAEVAHAYGLRLIAYEGGQGLVDWATRKPEQHPNPLFFAANRDPRMGELYQKLLSGWQQASGDLFVLFSAPRTCQWFGCWGVKEHTREPLSKAHKMKAIEDFMMAESSWVEPLYSMSPVRDLAVVPERFTDKSTQRAADEPRIVFRPASAEANPFPLGNPQTLDILLQGNTWEKKDIFGKWEGRWDEQYLYLAVMVFDDKLVADSSDPLEDDAIIVYLDADNSRGGRYDTEHDGAIVFSFADETAEAFEAKWLSPEGREFATPIWTEKKKRWDGYILNAKIPWSLFNVSMGIRQRLGIEVQVVDDDDGGPADQKIAWFSDSDTAINDPNQLGVVLVSGR